MRLFMRRQFDIGGFDPDRSTGVGDTVDRANLPSCAQGVKEATAVRLIDADNRIAPTISSLAINASASARWRARARLIASACTYPSVKTSTRGATR
jgi:hypothetical protein